LTQQSVLFSEFVDVLTTMGRYIGEQQSSEPALLTVARCCQQVVPAAEHAAISRSRDHHVATVVATSELPAQLDQLHQVAGGGPLTAVLAGRGGAVRIDELREASRWPEFGTAAADRHGVRSMLTVPLRIEDIDMSAALSLYSTRPDAFDESDELAALLLATHGALAVAAAERRNQVTHLERALQSNRRIGMAIGILMATRRLVEKQAFDLLRSASQSRHRKLFQLADEVIETGTLEFS
jgi:transcriptional regulator with GAF, ATPase, and Fis domain